MTHVTVSVSNLERKGEPFEADFLVDMVSLDCMGPKDRLLEAGIKPERKRVYELANGEPVEYEYGFARISLMGDETVAQIIFGPADIEPILGVVALESMGVVVDPVSRTLIRLPARPLK